MKQGFSIFGILVYSVLLIAGYHYALNHFSGEKFKVFNYQIKITRCGPKMDDRIDKIEKQVKPQPKQEK